MMQFKCALDKNQDRVKKCKFLKKYAETQVDFPFQNFPSFFSISFHNI